MNIPSMPNYRVFRTGDETAMIAFESSRFPDTRMVPRIHRFYRSKDCGSACDSGRVFGEELATNCVLLVNVTPLCLVQIVEWCPETGYMVGSFYRIGANFEVEPIQSEKRELSRLEIEAHLFSSPVEEPERLELEDADVRHLFSANQPSWLGKIVDAQLNHWTIHNVGLFYRYTSWPVTEEDIWRSLKATPYWTLVRWRDRLKPIQLDICIRNSPRGAVSFAIERLSKYQRDRYLEKYPADALTHSADQLTEQEVLRCAELEPRAAITLSCRRNLPPKLRAIVLAESYRKIRRGRINEPLPELQRDVLDSIIGYSEIWLAAHNGRFAEIMDGLAGYLSIQPDGPALIEMGTRLPTFNQKAFADYLGSLI